MAKRNQKQAPAAPAQPEQEQAPAAPNMQPELVSVVIRGLTEEEAALLFDHVAGYPGATIEEIVESATKVKPAPKVKATNPCLCGCGESSAKTFAPGHDMRLKGRIVANTKANKPAFDGLDEPQAAYAGANWAAYVQAAEERAITKRMAKAAKPAPTPAASAA